MKLAVPILVASAIAFPSAGLSADLAVDFARTIRPIRPALHSSGWTPNTSVRRFDDEDAAIRAMNFAYTRTHDWALVNAGQRIIDYQNVFPLFGKDAKDPSNYFFEPTDHILEISRNVGLKTFYRLGPSIEHTRDAHFNSLAPTNDDQIAEIFAGIVRHYNRGWANGRKWDIDYWEIWNEPDNVPRMWCVPTLPADGTGDWEREQRFAKMFVTCLRRLKQEFPEIKVGGPAISIYKDRFVRLILKTCRDAGVAPDFLSWHYYGTDPKEVFVLADRGRRHCDEFGFRDCELIVNEWHYVKSWAAFWSPNMKPGEKRRAYEGPAGLNGIDSACFTLSILAQLQTSIYSQAYFYGCGAKGDWGYKNEYDEFNKNYYACCLFGELVRDYAQICDAATDGTVTTLAVKGEEEKYGLLVVDYLGKEREVKLNVRGLPASVKATAVVLDHTHDATPCAVRFENGTLTLPKSDTNSAAFAIAFE